MCKVGGGDKDMRVNIREVKGKVVGWRREIMETLGEINVKSYELQLVSSTKSQWKSRKVEKSIIMIFLRNFDVSVESRNQRRVPLVRVNCDITFSLS